MGTNTYAEITDGSVADAEDVEQYRTGLAGNMVPRAASGAPTDQAGLMGTSTYRWKGLWLADANGGFEFKPVGASNKVDILDESGNQIDILGAKPSTSDGTDPDPKGVCISSSSGSFSRSASGYGDVTNLSCTLTTLGGPVELFLIPDGASIAKVGANMPTSDGGSADNIAGDFKFLRDATNVGECRVQTEPESGGSFDGMAIYTPPGSIRTIDYSVTAGTYTFKVQAKWSLGANGVVVAENCRLVAREL